MTIQPEAIALEGVHPQNRYTDFRLPGKPDARTCARLPAMRLARNEQILNTIFPMPYGTKIGYLASFVVSLASAIDRPVELFAGKAFGPRASR
jgi:hypothetical protein